jgi:hypothetical protein
MRTGIVVALAALIAGAPAVQTQSEAPPLILESNQFSYTFGVPGGWTFSLEQGRKVGVPLVFFPKGGSFDTSNSIVYVSSAKSACPNTCTEALPRAMELDIEESKRGNPNLHFESAPPIAIKAGGTASILVMSGATDEWQAREALAYIEHAQTIIIVVLTTRDPSGWTADYEVFRQIVAGHKFFDCSSPSLSVACR